MNEREGASSLLKTAGEKGEGDGGLFGVSGNTDVVACGSVWLDNTRWSMTVACPMLGPKFWPVARAKADKIGAQQGWR
jgi:hypothetical protein